MAKLRALPCYVCVWCACTVCFNLDFEFLLEASGVPRKAQGLFGGSVGMGGWEVTIHAL